MANIPPPNGAYTQSGGVWSPLTSTDPAGTGPVFTPPPAGLYAFNTGLNQWVPWSGGGGGGGAPSGPAGGDLTGTYPNPQVAGSSVNATFSGAAAASTPSVSFTSPPVTGTGTTATPAIYLNSGATAPTTFSVNGTVLGINSPSGFTGNVIDCHNNGGVSNFHVDYNGNITAVGAITAGGATLSGTSIINSIYMPASTPTLLLATNTVRTTTAGLIGWASSSSNATGAFDTVFTRQAAGIVQINAGSTAGNTGALSLAQVLLNGGTAAASTSQFYSTTPPYTAGTGSTNNPVMYLDSSGAVEPTSWIGGGTFFGINAPSAFAGNFIDVHTNGGTSLFAINSAGSAIIAGSAAVGSGCTIQLNTGIYLASTNYIGFSSTTAASGTKDVFLFRSAAGVFGIGTNSTTNTQGSLKVGQMTGGSGAPAIAGGTGAGTSPTVSVLGNNTAGQVSVTTGTSPTASGPIVTVTFANAFAYGAAPYVVFSPANAAAAALTAAAAIFVTATTTTFVLNAGSTALAASTQYIWNFQVVG